MVYLLGLHSLVREAMAGILIITMKRQLGKSVREAETGCPSMSDEGWSAVIWDFRKSPLGSAGLRVSVFSPHPQRLPGCIFSGEAFRAPWPFKTCPSIWSPKEKAVPQESESPAGTFWRCPRRQQWPASLKPTHSSNSVTLWWPWNGF